MEIGKQIAAGRTATVHQLPSEPGRVIKLLLPEYAYDALKEYDRMQVICSLGLPVPTAHRMETVGDRAGIVYDWVDGPSWLERIITNASIAEALAEDMAALHLRIHGVHAPELPVSDGGGAELCLCHGDFHPANILETAGGPVVIDWYNAHNGPAAADVARTLLLLTVTALPEELPEEVCASLKIIRIQCAKSYFRAYLRLSGMPESEPMGWIKPLAKERMLLRIPGEEAALEKVIREGLAL